MMNLKKIVRMVKRMKIIKNFIRTISAIFRSIYKFIDKYIVVPITKFILLITEKLGNGYEIGHSFFIRKNYFYTSVMNQQ